MRKRLLPILFLPAAGLLVAGLALGAKPSKRLSDDQRGELLYDRHCVQCHGPGGAGDGAATAALVHPVPDLRGRLDAGNRERNARLVLDGRGGMPGYETAFDRHDARRVIRHMEKKSAKKGAPPPSPKPAVTKDTGAREEQEEE